MIFSSLVCGTVQHNGLSWPAPAIFAPICHLSAKRQKWTQKSRRPLPAASRGEDIVSQKCCPNQSPIIDKNKPSLVDAWYAYGNFVQLYAQKWAD
jgi:hypothetical protein